MRIERIFADFFLEKFIWYWAFWFFMNNQRQSACIRVIRVPLLLRG